MNRLIKQNFRGLLWLLTCCLATTFISCEHSHESSSVQSIRDKDFGEYSITVYPISVANSTRKDVAEVVGLLLEKGGIQHIEIASQSLEGHSESSMEETGQQFANLVKESEFHTDHHAFGEFLGSPQEGVKEVRTYLCDGKGHLLWMDRQTPDDRDFKKIKAKDPMTCCVLMATRLQKKLDLKNPMRKKAPKGKMHQRWMEKSKIPDEEERNAMKDRLQALKKQEKQTVLVFPIRRENKYDAKAAQILANKIEEQDLFKTNVIENIEPFDIQASSNEQLVLWDLARKFKDYLQNEYKPVNYSLIADYMIGKEETHAVHFILCDAQGEWVIVDYQNSHHRDFKRMAPRNEDDCHQLVLRRLKHVMN